MSRFVTLAAASVLTLAGAAAFAQTPPAAPSQPQDQGRETRGFSRADHEALTDARIASIQAGLKLTTEQQALWPPVEQAIRAVANGRADRWDDRRDRRQEPADFMERIERQSENARQHAEPLVALTTAMKPLWATLDERQKRLLPVLIRPTTEFAARRMAMGEGRGDRDERRRGGRDGMGHHGMGHHGMMGAHHR